MRGVDVVVMSYMLYTLHLASPPAILHLFNGMTASGVIEWILPLMDRTAYQGCGHSHWLCLPPGCELAQHKKRKRSPYGHMK